MELPATPGAPCSRGEKGEGVRHDKGGWGTSSYTSVALPA